MSDAVNSIPSAGLCKKIPEGCFRHSFFKVCREWSNDGKKLPSWIVIPDRFAVLTMDKEDIESIYSDGHTPVFQLPTAQGCRIADE